MKLSLRSLNAFAILLILAFFAFSFSPAENTDQLTGYAVKNREVDIQGNFFWIGIFLFVTTTILNLVFFITSKN